MGNRVASVLLALVLGGGAALLLLSGERGPDPIQAGSAAPAFELPTLGGQDTLSLESLRGKVVLLNFWATWCKPCEDEMPAMQRLYESLAPQGFELVAVSVDQAPEPVEAFRQRMGLTFPILLDPEARIAGVYQSHRYPESYLIDAQGVLVGRFIGPREWDAPAYSDRVRRLLGAAPAES